MNIFPNKVKKALHETIEKLVEKKEQFVKRPNKDFVRNRKLSLYKLIDMIIGMGAGSLNKELLDYFDLKLTTPTSSAMIQQRDKLKPEALLYVLKEFTSSFSDGFKKYGKYRLLAVDGSKMSIARNACDEHTFVPLNQHTSGNFININALYDILNRVYLDAIINPIKKNNECHTLAELVQRSPIVKKVILIADRGYESYNNIAHLCEKGWKFVLRVKRNGILRKFDIPDNTEFDRTFTIKITRRDSKETNGDSSFRIMRSKHRFDFIPKGCKDTYSLKFRVVCIKIEEGNYQYLITNLGKSFSSRDLKDIYKKRWGIETSFRELKHTLGAIYLKSKKMEHIQQEVYGKMVLYNFSSIITSNVVIEDNPNRNFRYQVNFSMAMTICIKFLKYYNDTQPYDVEALIRRYLLPIREGRIFPRKTKPKTTNSFINRLA
jgi:hypothetical protein